MMIINHPTRPEWSIQYSGGRLADIYRWGHAVECVQAMDWDWTLGPCDQTAPEPTPETLAEDLAEFVEAYADDYALA